MNRKKIIGIGCMLALIILGTASYFLFFSRPVAVQADDFSKLSWTKAFDRLYGRISKEYAFTDWKGVDWQGLYSQYAPRIKEAEADKDLGAYYMALRAFLTEIPDGHVSMTYLSDIDEKYIGGGYGFAAARLSDGDVIITWVDPKGPAYQAGMRAGASLVRWNGKPIAEALGGVPTLFGGTSATTENLEAKQAQYLTRAPIGTKAQVEFQNAGQTAQTASLTAYGDNRLSLKKCYPDAVLSDKIRSLLQNVETGDPIPEAMVEKKALGDGIFYIKIWGELDMDLQQTGKAPSTLKLFRDALSEANAAGATSLILDIRNNLGGLDDMAAQILGSFYPEKTLYEYQNVYDPATGKRAVQGNGLYIEPAQPRFGGKVLCLINQKCVSSGEGIAKGIRDLPNGETLGLYGTNGSFGLTGTEISMPGGLTVRYPDGQSLDRNRQIQLDSRGGAGGVAPTVRIGMTAENAMRIANGEDIELNEAVRLLKETANTAPKTVRAACEPGTLPAKAAYDETVTVDIPQSEVASTDAQYYRLGGLFEGMTVAGVAFKDGKLCVSIQGRAAANHAYGPDMDNATGDIVVLPGAVKAENTTYTASVNITYPKLLMDPAAIDDKEAYDDTLTLTLADDTFAKPPTAEDIRLSGGFEGMRVDAVMQDGQTLTAHIIGKRNREGGSGIVTVAGSALKSGFSVDRAVTIADAGQLIFYAPLTIEKPFTETVVIGIQNDYFAKALTPDMFTLGGALSGAKITDVKTDSSLSIRLMLEDDALPKSGQGAVTLSGKGTATGRSVTGTISVVNPEITAFYVKGESNDTTHVYEVYSTGNDFEEGISAKDFSFTGALRGLTPRGVERFSGYHLRLTAGGRMAQGTGALALGPGAMGGIRGDDVVPGQVDSLADLGIGLGTMPDWLYGDAMNGQTGGIFDDAADWILGKLKDLALEGVKAGLKEGAQSGVMYALRKTGIMGPSVEDMLEEIESNLTALNQKLTNMTCQLSNQIAKAGLDGRVQTLQSAASSIDGCYATYKALTKAIDDYEKAHPGQALSADLQTQLDKFINTLGSADLPGKVNMIASSMVGTAGLPPLITSYYSLYRTIYPFEHNAVQALEPLVNYMGWAQYEGFLLYAEYCNYTGQTMALGAFTDTLNDLTAKQQALLPKGYQLNIRDVWGSPNSCDIRVKCNNDGKTYIIVGDAFPMKQCVAVSTEYGWTYYKMDPDNGILNDVLANRGQTGANAGFRFVKQADVDSLFACWAAYYKDDKNLWAADTFLDYYSADNGTATWLYVDTGIVFSSYYNYIFSYDCLADITFFNMLDGTYFTAKTTHLYKDIPNNTCKTILVQR